MSCLEKRGEYKETVTSFLSVVQQLLEQANPIPTDLSALNLALIAETSLHS